MNKLEMIAALSNANGVSGFEDEVLKVARAWAPEGMDISEDSLRNLYLRRRANRGHRPVVQLDAHSDEVGFMVHSIRPNGTLKFITMGGWVNSNIPAHRVRVQTKDGSYIPGVIAAKPPHFMSEAEKNRMPEVADMSIDVGACSLAEARDEFGIRIAAPVVPDVTFEYDEKHDLMFGKAFDNRLGCAAILATLDALGDEALDVDVVGAMASQEEVGTRGATVTANTVKPDIAIVFEGCPADDTVVPECEVQTAIHKGPMLRHIDKRMITRPHRRLHQRRAHPPVQPGRALHRGGPARALHPQPLRHRLLRGLQQRRQAGLRRHPPPGRGDHPLLLIDIPQTLRRAIHMDRAVPFINRLYPPPKWIIMEVDMKRPPVAHQRRKDVSCPEANSYCAIG